MKTVLVTGASGQLGQCIESMRKEHENFQFIFVGIDLLDITNADHVNRFFNSKNIDWCINCAAYTAVDNAESDSENAIKVNVIGAKNLSQACANHNAKIIHISTDFVFDGLQGKPYIEIDETNPLGVYGQTKLDGEREVSKSNPNHFIIRTSWLYSEYGNNFMKTMLRLSKDRNQLSIVCDQIGTPTYAKDLALTLLELIEQNSDAYGIYHYSNEGVSSWYDFAIAIFEIFGTDIKVSPINSEAYPTPAKRPSFSVLDKIKIKKELNINIPHWRDSLTRAISNLKTQ